MIKLDGRIWCGLIWLRLSTGVLLSCCRIIKFLLCRKSCGLMSSLWRITVMHVVTSLVSQLISYTSFIVYTFRPSFNNTVNISVCATPNVSIIISFPSVAVAQHDQWPPHSWGFYITTNDTPQSVRLLCTSDQLVTQPSTSHPCPAGNRTPDLSSTVAVWDRRLRPRGHRDRPVW